MTRRPPPQRFTPGRPSVVDQLRRGEAALAELLPLTARRAVPPAATPAGRAWRAGPGPQLRSRLVKLTNPNAYPTTVTARARGAIRALEERAVLAGHDRWWVTDRAPRRRPTYRPREKP